jgi:hypothetical protein
MRPKRAKTRQLPELPLLLCVHCQQMTTTPCRQRAWKVAETCPEMKKAEDDFYRRNAGGPVAMTSLTRGRGFLWNFQPDDHLGAYWTYEEEQLVQRELAEEQRTYHHAHIDAYDAVHAAEWLRDFEARRPPPHDAHWFAWFYHRYPHHRPAWMLNPFLIDP